MKKSVPLLILANLIPIFGVLLWGWSLPNILALYWLENGVVGVYALLRIHRAQQPATTPIVTRIGYGQITHSYKKSRFFLFFLFHYGLFTFMHGLALVKVFSLSIVPPQATVLLALAALFISHGASYAINFIGGGEYRSATPNGQMFAPYKRVFIMHLVVFAAAGGMSLFDSGIFALVALVGLKIVIDIASHLYEHSQQL